VSESAPELLDSPACDRLLAELRQRFDLIVIDSPPALGFADATALAARCDAAIVAVRVDKTARRDAVACVEALSRAGCRVIGLVLTDDPYAPGERALNWIDAARRAFARASAGAGAR
jgi:Mrp family chromosome partitioning ATPase